MKKILLSLSLVGLIAFNSCKDEKTTTGNENKTDTTAIIDSSANNTQTEAPTTEATSTELPKFEDKEVQEFVDSYSKFIKENEALLKDSTKIAEMKPKLEEWAQKSLPIFTKLANNPEELKKFTEYFEKTSK
ncbi:hypothetical protein ETU09_02400 [Apibacter muscae]|uniref:DUF3347 domain-containing protein n=1 Tax=Apibacter muscae TaxID=2509004 RepID=A0A563DIL0_9FLAO|nr:hypothetical protein [Apibacter muscae]TWP29851.1 hypothetical protein ETU09_02400 [Apibacter muscae]